MNLIGIDLGGTKIYGALLKGGEMAAEAKAKTPVMGGPIAVVDAICAVVDDLGGVAGIDTVGIGAPGVVTPKTGIVQQAPNLPGWMEPFPLAESVSEALGGTPVWVDNDVNVGTLAEHRFGAAKDVDDVLGVFVGTGVGAGIVLGGRLWRGPRGAAGEIGHVIVRPGGRLCGCGGRGHLEAYAGRAALERRARSLDAKGHDTKLVELAKAKRMTSSVFAKALSAGDAVAIDLIDEAVTALGTAVASAVTLIDVELVVVGGGLADRLGPSFVGRIEQAVRSQLVAGASPVRVVPAELGDRGGAMGAAQMAEDAQG